MRAFQGALHMNSDRVTWYGLAEMSEDPVFIRDEAERGNLPPFCFPPLRRATPFGGQLPVAAKEGECYV